MNRNFFLILAISVCLSAVFSCSKDEIIPSSNGGQLGQVTSDRTRYGVGQLATFSCTVTAGANLLSTEYSFVGQSNIEYPVTVQNGVVRYSLTPDVAGATTVKFKEQSVGIDGKTHTVESPLAITVVECDYLNSFWGDDVAECLKNNPDLEPIPGLTDDYSVERQSFKIGQGSAAVTLPVYNEINYFFENGQLISGYFFVDVMEGMSKFYHLYVGLELARKYTEEATYSYYLGGYVPSNEVSAILAKIVTGDLSDFEDTAKLALINEVMDDNPSFILIYQGKIRNTRVRLRVSSDGNRIDFTKVD